MIMLLLNSVVLVEAYCAALRFVTSAYIGQNG